MFESGTPACGGEGTIPPRLGRSRQARSDSGAAEVATAGWLLALARLVLAGFVLAVAGFVSAVFAVVVCLAVAPVG
jgi:UPF0716 family protein affecting phage T7 exclusion